MRFRFFALVAASSLAACAQQAVMQHITAPTSQAFATKRAVVSGITHVIIIIQENRSFDDMFNGFPGADTVQSGLNHLNQVVPLTPIPLSEANDLDHGTVGFKDDYHNGLMNGFDREGNALHSATYPYSYTQQSDVQPLWDMATQYVVGDRMFSSQAGPSFPAHQYLIAGQTGYMGDPGKWPWGCDGPQTKPECFDYETLADELDAAHVSWRYYAPGVLSNPQTYGIWVAYDAIRHIRYGPDWDADMSMPETNIFQDISLGTLANVSWIVPTGKNSDHAGDVPDQGPAWVSSIVNAVGESDYWPNTAIFVVWDDWGGWYDHVPPPQLDANGLGIRVPLIVVSPFAKSGYVSHVQHEFGSILKFTEEQFGLPSLGTTDVRADDLSDCFTTASSGSSRPQAVRRFVPIRAPKLLPVPEEAPDND